MLVRMQGKWKPYTLSMGMSTSKTTMETLLMLLKKLKIDLPYHPAIPLLGIYLKECDSATTKALAHPCLLQSYSQ
jgi:hypothetical protein